MGKSSKKKWEKRVQAYEWIVVSQHPSRAKEYLSKWNSKLDKFFSAANDFMNKIEREEGDGGSAP